MKRILIACTVVALAACSGKDENGDGVSDGVVTPDSVSQVAPSTPVGSVSGQVVKLDNSPIEGAKVTAIVGDKTVSATTNSAGVFSFMNLPAGGQVGLLFEKQGYATGRATGVIPASTGNFPLNNGNLNVGQIGLAALTGTARFRVITSEGAPASGASATIEFSNAALQLASSNASVSGQFSATTTAGADGLVEFANVPEFQSLAALSYWATSYINVAVSPWDENGDGFADWRGYYNAWQVSAFITQAPVQLVTLQSPTSPGSLQIVGTNLASFTEGAYSRPFKNALKGSEPITITFNQPINQVSTARWVKIVAEDCSSNVDQTTTQLSPWTIQITPNSGWTLGNKYNIAVHATGLDTGDTQTFIGYGFGLDDTQVLTFGNPAFEALKPAGATMETSIFRPSPSGVGPDILYVKFTTPIEETSGGAVIQFALDINANGNTTDYGETGNMYRMGFPMTIAEPLTATPANAGSFTCLASGFSTRWRVPVDSTIATLPGGITSGTQAKVLFPLASNSTGAYNLTTGATIQVDATMQAPMTVAVTPSSP